MPDVPVLVLLRDPVERFRSAMRLAATRAAAGNPSPWPYPVPITMQTFTGFYADQLAAWAAAMGRERMVVLVYEQVRRSPRAAVEDVWGRLGLDPVPLAGVDEASGSSCRADWDWPDGLKESLQVMYRPQLARLESDWGLDVSRLDRDPVSYAGARPTAVQAKTVRSKGPSGSRVRHRSRSSAELLGGAPRAR